MSEASKDFRATFDPEKQSIEVALAGLDKVPKDELQANIDSIVQRINALEKTAIKSMSEKLAQLRVRLVPKAKFSFKSRKTAGTTPPPASTLKPAASPKPTGSTPTIDQSQFLKFEDRTGEHLFIGSLSVSETESRTAKDVALTNLTDCTINLVHDIPLSAIHVKNLKRCTLVFPPVSGSILLHDCEGCTLIGACHQSRMHTSTNMNIYIHVTSEPIIEDCTDMRFAPYGQILPSDELDRLFEAAQLNQEVNLYDKVKDFNWLRQQQSPNWRLLEDSELQPEIVAEVLAKDRSEAVAK
ncbi:hypothetical protein EC957_006210 [Mortierella hygrophila]|uniref:C-CAP/cofactor C-like domain-containing protein n=1 Tax=Mortierella hygrophila TaxID=979708 RepID=A0A9P6EYC9_9FUNG|nr:hypothetical protein EC957_006210 [Mortierella hygrophila]